MLIGAAAILTSLSVQSANLLDLKDITNNTFSAENLRTVTPLADGETYAQMNKEGTLVEVYSFKTGKKESVLFDVNKAKGEKIDKFDNYIMSPDGKKMLIQTATKRIYRRSFTAVYYIYHIDTGSLERLSDYGPQQSPVWSPDGWQVAFVRDNNIHLVKLMYGNSESQVTKDGKRNEVINGIPDWVNEEEFGYNTALTFNADATMICWLKFDETAVREYSLEQYRGMKPSKDEFAVYPGRYTYKYPKAGEVNAKVSAWSYDIKSHQTRQLEVPLPVDGYMPRIKTTEDAAQVIVYTMNRHQDELCIYGVNPRSTVAQLLVKENVKKYVKEEAMENVLFTSQHILMPSDRDGQMQVYLYTLTGSLQKKLTQGGPVTDIYGYDEASGNLYYQAIGKNPMNREIYCTNSKTGKTQQLSSKEGWNSGIFSSTFKYYINTWSDCNTPYVTDIRSNQGKVLCTLIDNNALKQKLSAYQLPGKEFFQFTTSEGVQLNGVMLKPADFNPQKRYPVVMWQYSGPGSQQVVNGWHLGSMGQGALYDAYLTQLGFIVVCVDGRGTGGRDADFEKCIYKKMGELEAKDQVETAVYLGKQPFIDKDRIGIWGWSYGGFCTLMSMSEGRPVFKAGVAVAPPTDWRFYDSIYTERYMQTPQENAAGYNINPINRVSNFSGSLLLCHGLADDNVHPQNTFEYTEALVQADKDFKMNVYTNRNHSIYGGNTRNHLLRQIASYFVEKLK